MFRTSVADSLQCLYRRKACKSNQNDKNQTSYSHSDWLSRRHWDQRRSAMLGTGLKPNLPHTQSTDMTAGKDLTQEEQTGQALCLYHMFIAMSLMSGSHPRLPGVSGFSGLTCWAWYLFKMQPVRGTFTALCGFLHQPDGLLSVLCAIQISVCLKPVPAAHLPKP